MRNGHATAICACGAEILARSDRCRACYLEVQAARRTRPRCQDCGGRTYHDQTARRCGACWLKVKGAKWICPDCGERKGNGRTKRCAACYQAARARMSDDATQVMLSFDARAFRALINRTDVEWSPRLLAVNTGVHERTIRDWLSGRHRPSKREWKIVASFLALNVCTHCHGSGMLDPTRERVTQITDAVRRSRPERPRPAGTYQIGRLSVYGAEDLAEYDGRSVELTPTETRILVELMKRPERLTHNLDLDVLVWGDRGGSSSRLTTHWSRLLDKLERVGAEGYLVTRTQSRTGSLRGISARCEREEAVS